jgi:GTPase
VVEDTPGVTRDRVMYSAHWNGRNFTLVDTGGWEHDARGIHARVAEQAEMAVELADAVLFVVDSAVGATATDEGVMKMLRRSKKPVIMVANKVDDFAQEADSAALWGLGFGEPYPVSALHGRGVADLLDHVMDVLPEFSTIEGLERSGGPRRIALIGRPNVGKSSLVNRVLGEERVIVSDLAGTTRDSIDTKIEIEGRQVVLIDTAGLRRRAKVAGSVDWYAQLRSERAAERADVAIVMCDSSEGVTTEDMRIADLAMHKHCATVMALNKWDINDTDLEFVQARIKNKLRQRPRVLTVSATGGRGVRRLLLEAIGLADRARGRIPTTELNRFLSDIQAARQPPNVRGKRLKMYYMTQFEERPPRFSIQVNEKGAVTRDYAFFMENRLRERYGLEGVPLIIDFRTSS